MQGTRGRVTRGPLQHTPSIGQAGLVCHSVHETDRPTCATSSCRCEIRPNAPRRLITGKLHKRQTKRGAHGEQRCKTAPRGLNNRNPLLAQTRHTPGLVACCCCTPARGAGLAAYHVCSGAGRGRARFSVYYRSIRLANIDGQTGIVCPSVRPH